MDHGATMRKAYQLINDGDIDGFGELLADDFVEHEATEFPPTKDGVKQFFSHFRAAFPDLNMAVEDVIAGGDKVVVRARCTGTNTGEFMGMPATGKSIDVQAVDIVRFDEAGKGVEHWGLTDTMTMMQQLGVVPEGAPA
jgi:steroid delta-isomerase-like uncharacterized protein